MKIQESKIQLSIQYDQVCLLSDNEKEVLIIDQAKRIPDLQDWEVRALLDLCNYKRQRDKSLSAMPNENVNIWMDRGLAVLYEYAGFLDSYSYATERLEILQLMYYQSNINEVLTSQEIHPKKFSSSTYFYCNFFLCQSNQFRL
mmetsp:Transcript_10482/g.14455  ORF Transcript_10482/g.14455 Transcript_10482/m.14455 type:complete len:144 (-) Transcript_10482:2087-2518(-)